MKGSCLCGGVRFEVGRFVPHTTNCFCAMCRKFHGAAYATYGVVPRQELVLLAGEALLQRYRAANGTVRSFCRECGSSLFYQGNADAPLIDVALGAMDDEPGVVSEVNIYTAYRAGWVELPATLPAYEEGHDLA